MRRFALVLAMLALGLGATSQAAHASVRHSPLVYACLVQADGPYVDANEQLTGHGRIDCTPYVIDHIHTWVALWYNPTGHQWDHLYTETRDCWGVKVCGHYTLYDTALLPVACTAYETKAGGYTVQNGITSNKATDTSGVDYFTGFGYPC